MAKEFSTSSMHTIPPPSTYLKGTVFAIAFQMIGDKDYTAYDFAEYLRKYRGKVFQSSLEIKSEEGHNILQEMVIKGRISFFIVIIAFGWWKLLSHMKIPSNGQHNEYSGCNAMEIAEKKRAKKTVEELKIYDYWDNSLTSLMKASRAGDIAKVKSLINNNNAENIKEMYLTDNNGWNSLHWAVVNGNIEILILLLDSGLDASVVSKKKETLLHIACVFGQSHLVKTLIQDERCKLDSYIEDISYKSAYDRVAENGDITTLNILQECGCAIYSNFLVLAAFSGRQKCVEHCVNDLQMNINGRDVYSRTALHRACENQKDAVVRFLLRNGADIEAETCSKRNIFHIIAETGSESLFNILLQEFKNKAALLVVLLNNKDRYNGVELCFLIRGRDKGRDAWHYVEVKRWLVPLFLQKTKDGNVDVSKFGEVINSGWGVNPDQECVTEIEQMFKQRRLNPNAKIDMTPLHIAIFKGNTELAKKLMSHGAKANDKDCFQLTPLMIAAGKGNLELVQALEQAGALLDDVNCEGLSARDIANECEQDHVINYFSGMNMYQLCQNFVSGCLQNYRRELDKTKLDQVRSQGKDVKTHIVNTLRDMKIDINQYLERIGSGPVLEATEE